MNLLDLCDDILVIVVDEVFRERGRQVNGELLSEWFERRPHKKIASSGFRKIHEGRSFLSRTSNLKDLELISQMKVDLQKYYYGGYLLYRRSWYDDWDYGPVFAPLLRVIADKEEELSMGGSEDHFELTRLYRSTNSGSIRGIGGSFIDTI